MISNRMIRVTALLIPVLMLMVGQIPNGGYAQSPTEGVVIPKLLADGQFVHGPNVGNFKIHAYLEDLRSPLMPHADIIEEKAYYYSINPRVLLTILEMQGGLVTGQQENLPGHGPVEQIDGEQLHTQLDRLSLGLTAPFYKRLYAQYGVDQLDTQQVWQLKDDTTLSISTMAINAGTYGLLCGLASSVTADQWKQLVSPQSETGFVQTYRRLFPSDDPLDESNQLNPLATPPANMLKLPFKECDTWKFTGGPHGWNGSDTPWSSLDFAPSGHSGCSIPTSRWVVAAASGSVEYHASYYVRINHGNGWATDYFHLANLRVRSGHVDKDEKLANPSCNGGTASGAHVHFAIVYGGARQAISGTSLEGWVVHKGSEAYQGYLQKGDTKVYQYGTVQSDITAPTTSISLAGDTNPTGSYVSNVRVTLTAKDNGGCTGVKYIKYQVDGGTLQRHDGSSVAFTVSGSGNHTIKYYAKDKAENYEAEKLETFSIAGYKIFLPLVQRH